MRVGTKLSLNTGTVLVLMAAIGVVAVGGTRFIQAKIVELTQRSTPYQVAVFNQQRALQAHAGSLLKVASSANADEWKRNAATAAESLADQRNATKEMERLSGKNDSVGREIEGLSKAVSEMTGKKLETVVSTEQAAVGIRAKLAETSGALEKVDKATRKLQQDAVQKMLTSINVTVGARRQVTSLSTLQNGFKDLMLTASRIPGVGDKRSLAAMKDEVDANLKAVLEALKTAAWGMEGEGDTGEDLEKRTKDVGPKLENAIALRMKFLKDEDESTQQKVERLAKDVEYEIAYMMPAVAKEADRATLSLKKASEVMTKSVEVFSSVNQVLMAASSLNVLNQTLAGGIQTCLAAGSLSEFEKAVTAVQGTFDQAALASAEFRREAAKTRGLGQLPPVSSDGAESIRKTFLGQDGVVERFRSRLVSEEEVGKLNQKMKEIVGRQIRETNKDVEQAKTSQETAVASVGRAVRLTILATVAIALVAALLSIGLSTWTGRSILKPVRELSAMAELFGKGDFTRKLDAGRKDEFGQLAGHFNQATENLRAMTERLSEAIAGLAASSKGLSGTAEDLNRVAKQQAERTEQSAAAVHQLSQTVADVSRNAANAAAASGEALKLATSGKQIVGGTLTTMEEIAVAVGDAGKAITKLKDGSDRISAVTGLIGDIADQTNLLALNAAIESARAGEQGRGFAVVADEVRKLAERTATATREISDIIHEIHGDTGRSVAAMTNGTRRVEEGVKLAQDARESMEATVVSSQFGVEMAQTIAAVTVEQSSAAADVSRSMEDISSMTKQLEQATTRVQGESEELSRLAGQLIEIGRCFKT